MPDFPDDFEFMTWLRAGPPTRSWPATTPAARQLRELIGLVTAPSSPSYGDVPALQHNYVRVLIDGGDDLSAKAVAWLIRETCWLHGQLPEKMQLTLFLDATWHEQVARGVWEAGGSVALYELRGWEEKELTEMLRLRLATWGKDSNVQEEWAQALLCKPLELAAQRRFICTIVQEAQKAAQAGTSARDAPLHALWLTRSLVTELARREQAGDPPLALKDIKEYVNNYRDRCADKEETR